MPLDFSVCRLPPFAHQREDTQALINHPYFFIASEMRTGKTKIVIDAVQFLYEAGLVNRVIIVTPAPVRDVWADKDLGELAKHLWHSTPALVMEYHARIREWRSGPMTPRQPLEFYVTNFEFIRGIKRLNELIPLCGPRTMLVGDESSFLKNWKAQQTESFYELRKACGRVVLLNGTPIFHDPMDLFSQGNILHPSVLDCKYITHFKGRYTIQEVVRGHGGKPLTDRRGHPVMTVKSWINLDDLQRRFAPVTVRRLQAECLDLPPKLEPVTLTATLTPETWKAYKDMRDELVVWLKDGNVATSATAAIRVQRLSQITSGFLGGVEAANIEPVEDGLLESIDLPGSFLDGLKLQPEGAKMLQEQTQHFNKVIDYVEGSIGETKRIGEPQEIAPGHMRQEMTFKANYPIQELGREKLNVLLWFIEQRLEADPNLHLVAWCRYRAEAFRTIAAVVEKFPQFEAAVLLGGQKRDERLRALSLLKPETSPKGPVVVVGVEGTGSFGLDMCAAHTCVTLSSGYSPGKSAQTLDRVYGPGQKYPIAYFDVVAVGPKGQKTIDHDILVARRAGEDVARRTASAWVKRLTEE